MYLAMRNSFWCVLIYTLISHGLAAPGATSNTASLLTFNTGLVPQTPNYAQRRTETAEAIKEIDADVVCLQEVWFTDDLRNILNVNDADIYPHSFSDLHETDGVLPAAPATAPCLNHAFVSIVYQCFLENCIQYANNGIQSLQCAIQVCDAYTLLDRQCLSCLLIAAVPNLGRCLTPGVQMNEPGLLMLSKYPLTDVRITKYEEFLYQNGVKIFFPRAYITAEIDGIGTVACTHTTSNSSHLGYFEFGLPYGDWYIQSLKEMEILVDALKDERRVVIIGDLNAGPTLPQYNIAGDLEESYNYLISAGYEQTYSFTGYKCTYCVDNAIRQLEDKIKGDQIIDHVLVRNIITAQFEAKRVLDENPSDPLSDHYGILAKVFKNPSSNN